MVGGRGARLCLAGTLRVAANNLDAVGVDLVRVVELEVDILDDKGPDVVAEAVRVEMALEYQSVQDGAAVSRRRNRP